MKTESMVKEAILNELKDYEFEKKMTDEEMAGIKGGDEKKKINEFIYIQDDEVPL